MLKYFAKIFKDIFPSVLATVIGAFIVNHYIIAKPATESPAAQTAPAAPAEAKTAPAEAKSAPAEVKTAPAEAKTAPAAEVAHQTPPRVRAKGLPEKANKANTDKPLVEKPAEADAKTAETAVAHGRPPASHEKATAKVTPAPIAVPAVSAPAADPAPPSAAGAAPDANDLARAAIERLHKASPAQKPAQEPARETAHVQEAPRVQEPRPMVAAPSVRPLPPPITVSAPAAEGYGTPSANPPYTASVGSDDADRPTPPADIPLGADAGPTSSAPTNGAPGILSAAKSVFHVILPKAPN